MSIIYSLEVYSEYNELFKLWNREIGFIYPITQKIIEANVLNDLTLSKENSFVAVVNDEVAGFVISKIGTTLTEIPEYQEFGWISLMYVSKKYRKQGIGSQLLTLAEEGLFKAGAKQIFIGKDLNNFFPGIPIDFNNLSRPWFTNRGYDISYQTHDLIARTKELCQFKIRNNQYIFRLATENDSEKLIEFVRTNFSNRWAYDVEKAFKNQSKGNNIAICLDEDEIIAFCKINDSKQGEVSYNTVWYNRFTHLGGIGPLGVSPLKRKSGLGYDIVAWSINYLIKLGVSEVIIDWTGLLIFYQQFGFEVWKSFFYASKQKVLNKS